MLPTFARMGRQYFVVAVLSMTPALARAASAAPRGDGVSAMDVVRVFGGLVLVLGVLLGGLWLMKRFGIRGMNAPRGQLRVISSLSVGNRARLLLVQVREAQMLIGVSAQRVELVARFDAGSADTPAAAGEASFVERLRQSLDREQGNKDESRDRLADVDRGSDSPRE